VKAIETGTIRKTDYDFQLTGLAISMRGLQLCAWCHSQLADVARQYTFSASHNGM